MQPIDPPWVEVNREALDGSRPWIRSTGRTARGDQVVFTRKSDTVYVVVLGSPPGPKVGAWRRKASDKPVGEPPAILLKSYACRNKDCVESTAERMASAIRSKQMRSGVTTRAYGPPQQWAYLWWFLCNAVFEVRSGTIAGLYSRIG